MSAAKLDDYDVAILRLLQEDAGRSQREIADAVNLSAPAVQRRIARLQREGVIRKTVAVLDPAAVGFPITVIVEATLADDRLATTTAAKDFFRAAPEVQQCYCVTGWAGLIVMLSLPSMEDYERRTSRLFSDNDLIKSYRTAVVLDRVKTGFALPF